MKCDRDGGGEGVGSTFGRLTKCHKHITYICWKVPQQNIFTFSFNMLQSGVIKSLISLLSLALVRNTMATCYVHRQLLCKINITRYGFYTLVTNSSVDSSSYVTSRVRSCDVTQQPPLVSLPCLVEQGARPLLGGCWVSPVVERTQLQRASSWWPYSRGRLPLPAMQSQSVYQTDLEQTASGDNG